MSDTPRTDALLERTDDEVHPEWHKLAHTLERDNARLQKEVGELRRIRELCIKSLIMATGASWADVECGPMTVAVAKRDLSRTLESDLSALRKENEALTRLLALYVDPEWVIERDAKGGFVIDVTERLVCMYRGGGEANTYALAARQAEPQTKEEG